MGPRTVSPQSVAEPSASASSGPSDERRDWRKPRYISIAAAIRRLEPHVDVPIVLPRDAEAGLPSLKGWLADPKYLD